MANIFIFGDSITYGCWDEKGGWATRLKHFIDSQIVASNFTKDHFVYPLGIPGDTTYTLLRRFKQETDARIVPTEQTIFLFAIGVNDSIFNNKTNSHVIPLWKFKDNLHELCKAAARYTDKIFFIGFTPVDESRVDPMSWLPESSYKNVYIQAYNDAIGEVCQEEKVSFIEIFHHWMHQEYQALLQDGIHPNSQGHEKLFETALTTLKTILE